MNSSVPVCETLRQKIVKPLEHRAGLRRSSGRTTPRRPASPRPAAAPDARDERPGGARPVVGRFDAAAALRATGMRAERPATPTGARHEEEDPARLSKRSLTKQREEEVQQPPPQRTYYPQRARAQSASRAQRGPLTRQQASPAINIHLLEMAAKVRGGSEPGTHPVRWKRCARLLASTAFVLQDSAPPR